MVYFENMDVLLNLLMLKASAMPELFDRRWTCMEFIWWLKLSNADYESSANMLLSNVRSELSTQCLIPWHEVDRVYEIAHLHGDHWAAYETSLVRKVIRVMESISSAKK